MFLTVCSSSTESILASVASLKADILGATATSTAQDAKFEEHLERATEWAETYIGGVLRTQSYSQILPGYGTPHLMVQNIPIRAVDRMYDATDTGSATQVLSSEFRVDREAGFVNRDAGYKWSAQLNQDFGTNPVPGSEERPWLVDYRAGWTLGGIDTGSPNWSTEKGTTSTGPTVPADIKQAILARATLTYNSREDVVSEWVGDLKVNYSSGGIDGSQPDSAVRALHRYRRWA